MENKGVLVWRAKVRADCLIQRAFFDNSTTDTGKRNSDGRGDKQSDDRAQASG